MIEKHTEELSKTYRIKYTHITLTDGKTDRTAYVQHSINFKNGREAFLVGDGNFNKKECATYKIAHRAFESCVGKLFLDGYTSISDGTYFEDRVIT